MKENYLNTLSDTIDEMKTSNPKEYWSIIRTLLKGSKPSHNLPPLFTEHDIAFSDEEKCDLLNHHFCHISSLPDQNKNLPDFESRTATSFSNLVIDRSEIVDVLEILDIKKASGPDDISHKLLKTYVMRFQYLCI